MKSLRPLLILAIVSVIPLALTACDLLNKKKGGEDAGAAPAADTVAPTAADPAAAPATPAAGGLATATPAAAAAGGHAVPAVARKLPDGGTVLVNAADGGLVAPGTPFTLPTALPSNFPKTLPSGFPSSLPSGFPTTLPSGFPQFPAPSASVKH